MQEKRLHIFVSLNKTARSLGRLLNNRHVSLMFKQFPWYRMKKHFGVSVLTHCIKGNRTCSDRGWISTAFHIFQSNSSQKCTYLKKQKRNQCDKGANHMSKARVSNLNVG